MKSSNVMINKRILAVVYNTIENDGRVIRSAEALSKKYDVVVASIWSPENYRNTKFGQVGIKIDRDNIFKVIISYLSYYIRVIKIARYSKPEIIYAHDYFISFVGYLVSKLNTCRFIYDAHELYIPQENVIFGVREKFWYELEKIGIRSADLLIAANSSRALEMKKHYKLKYIPMAIYNIPSLSIERSVNYSDYTVPEKLNIIVYQGDVNYERNLERFLISMKYLNSDYCLLIIGSGPDLQTIRREYKDEIKNGKIVVMGKIPLSRIRSVLAKCSLGIVTYSNIGINNRLCAPNKLFEYAQAGIPMVTSSQKTLTLINDKYKIGISIPDDLDPKLIANTMENIISNSQDYSAGLIRLMSEYTYSSQESKLNVAVDKL